MSRHEKDARWTAVDEFAKEHVIKKDPFDAALQFAAENQREGGLRDIAVSTLQGKFLALQCKLIRAKNVLEVGTLGGYSAIFFASSSPDLKVTTIEVDANSKAVAEKAITHAKLSDRIEVLLGPGIEVLPRLKEEVNAGKREKFDLVFIDADKINNLNYLNEAIEMSRSGSCIIVDNVVQRGSVADAEGALTNQNIRGAREVIEGAGKDSRIDCTVLQTVGEKNYDGFMLCYVK